MITIGFSTREIDNNFIEHIKNTCGPKNIEIIPFENKGTHSLSEAYNIILEKSTNDIVVLCHDDIYFDKKGWGNKLIKHFDKNPEYGILGVAGSTFMPKSGMWWEDNTKMKGIVNHEHNGKKWESKYSNSLGNKLDEVVIVDGLFIAIQKNRITKKFNENVKGFHFYDVTFSFENFLNDVKIGVMYDVRITHKSIGQTNEQWENNRAIFSERNSEILPLKVLKDENSILKILLLFNELNSEILSSLENHDLTMVSEKKSGKKNIFDLSSIPGTILGDGKTQLNTGTKVVPTVKGRLYKNKNIEYDLIISNSKFLSEKIKILYPNINHLFIGNEVVNHNSIIVNKSIPKDLYKISNNDINKPKVKILTGFSERGGSTFALSRICNYFNKNGINTVMYGPHDFHLSLCKSDTHSNFKFDEDDILITHFVDLKQRPNVKKVVLSCHEKNIFELSKLDSHWDEVVFLNQKQRNYHLGYNGEYSIIPNFSDVFECNKLESSKGVAGIIGSIDYNKQTHISIGRALNDGYKKIILFGGVTDLSYYETYVKPLIDGEMIIEYGFIDDRPKMYSMIECVYQSSLSEVSSLVKEECEMTNTKFYGNKSIENDTEYMSDDEIFKKWKKVLEL
jgi:hypothetical protein